MNTKKTNFFFLFFFINTLLYAQVVPFEKYTTKNGLIADRITAITQDEKGFMWFGSFFGICRYNGINFDKIALPDRQHNKYVTFLLPANNKIYAGFLFNGGLAEYANGKVTPYFIRGKDSAFANEFTCAAKNNDSDILLGNTSGQIYQFKNGTFTHLYTIKQKVSSYPTSIVKDKYNNIWMGTENGLIIIPYPYQTENFYYPGENIFSLVKDKSEKIWFSKATAKTTTIQTSDGWQHGNINESTVAASSFLKPVSFSGNTAQGIWAIDYKKGMVNVANNKSTYYTVPLDFTTDINAVFADRENNIWIANEPGVFKISNFSSQFYLFDEIAAGGGTLDMENDSLVWATNSKYLYHITQNNIKKIKFDSHKSDYYGKLYVDAKKNLWIGLWNEGLWKIKWNKGRLISKKFFSEYDKYKIKAHTITEDSNGNIWAAGANGIFRIKDDKIITNFHPKNAAGMPAFITCMAIDESNNVLWLGDNALGLIKIKYQIKKDFFTYAIEKYITSKNGLTDEYIRSLSLDKENSLWVGTRSGGIYQIKDTDKNVSIINHNSTANISCTRITDIKQEGTSAIWFATCDGIFRYHFFTKKWKHYNTSDGLLNAEVFNIAVDENNNCLWALTSHGVTKLQISPSEKSIAPLINIIGINILGKPDSFALLSKQNIKYSYTQNSIGFTFAGASFIDEKKIKYKYMLEGYDKNWSEPMMTNNVNYASLPAAKYVFKVLAANAKGQWSTIPATFRFQIVIPFYLRTWFIFMLITISLFILYLIRLRQLKQRYKIEKLRVNIAGDLHDDIGSALGSINLLSKTATRRLDKNQSGEDISLIFQKIGQSAENILEAMDDIVWAINPEKDKIDDLIVRMREFAIPLLEAQNILFSFDVKGNNETAFPMNLRRNIFLIFKEAIHNILKHSNALKVDIKLNIHHNQFLMEIRDNGKGFNTALPSTRNGIKNMHRRSETIGGTLQINSSPAGTSILFTVSIK